ncbi:[protein-PII] uridylyltransferase family protein [Nitrospira sp. Kam-Ns4a]
MTVQSQIEILRPLCREIPDDLLQDFVSRMDDDYFAQFAPEEIARHLTLVARLEVDRPCQVDITERPDGLFDVVVVAFDYFSEFATICGVLSAHRLDIREGSIHTLAEAAPPPRGPTARPVRPAGRARLTRKKIVDVFRVQPLPGSPFGPAERRNLAEELAAIIHLLDEQRFREARSRVNRRLVETLGQARAAFTGLLHPVHLRFDNDLSPTDTVVDIRSTDTPMFLYAFANALAMRGIYIRKARFENAGTEVRDRFYVRGRHGRKLDDPAEQQVLRVTAALIKQFTHSLTWAPDPAQALESFDGLLDQILEGRGRAPGRALRFLTDPKSQPLLARLLGTSEFLWEDFLRRQHENLLPVLENYQRLPLIRPRAVLGRELRRRLAVARGEAQRRQVLNQYKDRELFRIDMKHLLDPATTLPDFSRALTELAEAVVAQACQDCGARLARTHGTPRLADRRPCGFALFGLGKFGGRELGYASDIEVLFVYEGPGRTAGRRALDNGEYFERLAQEFLQWIEARQEGIFHVDVRLRPHGGKGLLANRVDELQSYYSPSGLCAPFERQALIKLRFVAGDRALGQQVEALRDAFVYSGEPWDLPAALALRRQQIKELVEPGHVNVKYSPGGLIDIEYLVQYLQIMHGHRLPAVRTPNTLDALRALTETGVLAPDETAALGEAYLFLRGLIDALRIVRGNAKDLVLPAPESDAFIFLARRLGYAASRWEEGAARLAADIARHMERTQALFAARFGAL